MLLGSTSPSGPTSSEPNGGSPAVPASAASSMARRRKRLVVGGHRLLRSGRCVGPAGGDGRKCLPGRLRVAGLARVAVERVEHDGVGAEPAQLFEVVDDLVDVPSPASRSGSVIGASVSRRAIRGARAGTGRCCSSATAFSRSERLAQPGGGEPQRVPGVAEAYRAAQAGVAVAADPDRDPPGAVVRRRPPRRRDAGGARRSARRAAGTARRARRTPAGPSRRRRRGPAGRR